jgi:uncharacterized protein
MKNTTAFLASVWRYPVKSMMGEELNAAHITENGLHGDRGYALVDLETDKIVSAKNPKKWPEIFSFHARYATQPEINQDLPPVWISLPNGDQIRSDQDDAEERLSIALKRSVSLRSRAPLQASLEQYWPEYDGQNQEISQEAIAADAKEGSFFDYATVHIITTASLAHLQGLYPAGRMEARRFRPNIVINAGSGESGFLENEWVGKTLCIGGVRLEVTDPCPRCVMPTLAQSDLPQDSKIMKIIAENTVHVPFAGRALPSMGVYARVTQPGLISRNSPVTLE